MPTPSFSQTRDALLQARQRFADRAMLKMYPSLKGHARTLVVLREQRRSNIYAARMQQRLSTGMRSVNGDPSLAQPEKEQRIQALIEGERRYLAMHIAAVGWRIARSAELERLVEAGDTEGYWLIDYSKRTHTPDCLAAAGRVHSVAWLRQYGPQTRHAGCGCRTIRVREARLRGFPLRRGYVTPAAMMHESYQEIDQKMDGFEEALAEAVKVPVRPGVRRAGDPYSAAREVTIHGNLHRSLVADMREYLDAVRAGDGLEMEYMHDELRRAARGIKSGPVRERQLRLIDRVHAAAVNPAGASVRYGTHVRIGGHEVPVPLSVYETEGLEKGWTSRGRFAWLIAPGALGTRTDEALKQLAKGSRFQMTSTPEGTVVESGGRLSPKEAHSAAIALERQLPQLRRVRIVKRGTAFGDDTPLDLRRDLAAMWDDESSRHRRITRGQVGDAGELAMKDVAREMKRLGLIPHGQHKPIGINDGRRHGKLDAVVGDLGVEIKSTSLRSMVGGRRAGTISAADRAGKLAMADAKGLRPALVHPIVDFDNGVVHVFAHVYEKGKGFHERRMPASMIRDLVDGKLEPGQEREAGGAGGGGNRMTYVGTFPLRYNPNDLRDQGRNLRDAQGRMHSDEVARRLKEPKSADVQISARRRASKSERDAQIVALAGGGAHTQGEIAEAVGVSQATVSRVLRDHNIHLGSGYRSDRRKVRA